MATTINEEQIEYSATEDDAARETECWAFYLFGRTEHHLETISKSNSLSERELRARISALFQSTSGRPAPRAKNRMSVLRPDSGSRENQALEPVARQLNAYGALPEQSGQSAPQARRGRPPNSIAPQGFQEGSKTGAIAGLIVKMLKSGPRGLPELNQAVQQKLGTTWRYPATDVINRRLLPLGVVQRKDGMISLSPGSGASRDESNSGRGRVLSAASNRIQELVAEKLQAGPNNQIVLGRQIASEANVSTKSVAQNIRRMALNRSIVKKGLILSLPSGAPRKSVPAINGSGTAMTVLPPRKGLGTVKLGKGEATRILIYWLKRVGRIKQSELNQRIINKNPGVAPQAFAGAAANMIFKGSVTKYADGSIELKK